MTQLPGVSHGDAVTSNAASAAYSRDRMIDADALMQINSLELRARAVVEGLWSGLNRSPYHGFSVEFTEYRQYTSGDDTRYLDWRLYARSDRCYIKRFEDETNLRCHVLLDMSRSMEFGSLSHTKAEYAKTLAATLCYFLSTQRDATGLVTFDQTVKEYIPARFRTGHLRRILLTLEQPASGRGTDLAEPLNWVAERIHKRGMLILISDVLSQLDSLESSLRVLTVRGHETILFHILDPAEIDFTFQEPMLFEDLESGATMHVDPQAARKQYQKKFGEHLQRLRDTCDKVGVTYQQLITNTPMGIALAEFLRHRQHANLGRISRPTVSSRSFT